VNHLGERSEFCDQRLGQRLDVAPRQRAKQYHFEQFVIIQRIGAGVAKAVTQPFAMAVIMRGLGIASIAVPSGFCNRHYAGIKRQKYSCLRTICQFLAFGINNFSQP